jgi:hypothetical protein
MLKYIAIFLKINLKYIKYSKLVIINNIISNKKNERNRN